MLVKGDPIPKALLPDENDTMVELSALSGSYIVLYAYPKDDTPGCTAEACSFRDQSQTLSDLGVSVFGISPDPPSSHRKFKRKYNLNFTLLSDEGHVVLEQLGAWGEKSMYGKTYMGVLRSTYLFGPDGTLLQTWPKVTPATHGEEIAAYLQSLKG